MDFSLFVNTSKALEGEDITTINIYIFFAKQQSGIEKKIKNYFYIALCTLESYSVLIRKEKRKKNIAH